MITSLDRDFIQKHLNIGEFVDRFTVDLLYTLNIESERLPMAYDELVDFMDNLSNIVPPEIHQILKSLVLKLLALNSRIWGLESTIRMGSDCKLPLDEVGRRTIEIRDLNRLRGSVKSQIAKLIQENPCQTDQK
jgi:hypothetical protein